MNDDRKAQLLAEIIALTAPPDPVGDQEFTVGEFAAAGHCGRKQAQDRLDRLVERGQLTRRQATQRGRPCWAYRKVQT